MSTRASLWIQITTIIFGIFQGMFLSPYWNNLQTITERCYRHMGCLVLGGHRATYYGIYDTAVVDTGGIPSVDTILKQSWAGHGLLVPEILSDGRPTLARTNYIFMTNHCSTTVQVDGSLVLALTYQEKLPSDRDRDFTHCDLDLLAPEGRKLFAHFLQMGISPSVDHSDRVQIFDPSPNNTRLTPIKGLYGKLDRKLSLFDDSGHQVNDYRTSGNRMKVDYLGKPTVKSPGFRLLVTSFEERSYGGWCPDSEYLCRHAQICIPVDVVCDGKPNCGNGDDSDERGCDRYDTVTSLLAEYSLVTDIIVVILLPVVVFIVFVVVTFLLAQRYIRMKVNKPQLPAVHFSPKKGGQVRIAEDSGLYAPPSYDDVLGQPRSYDPPPAYQGLSCPMGEICSNSLDSVNEATISNSQRRGNMKKLQLETQQTHGSSSPRDAKKGSMSEDLDKLEHENYRLHGVWPSDTDDDEEIKTKRRRKGGRGKIKGKRTESNTLETGTHVVKSVPVAGDSSLGKCSIAVPSDETASEPSASNLSKPDASSLDTYPNCESCSPADSPNQSAANDEHCPSECKGFITIHIKPKSFGCSLIPSNAEITETCAKS